MQRNSFLLKGSQTQSKPSTARRRQQLIVELCLCRKYHTEVVIESLPRKPPLPAMLSVPAHEMRHGTHTYVVTARVCPRLASRDNDYVVIV